MCMRDSSKLTDTGVNILFHIFSPFALLDDIRSLFKGMPEMWYLTWLEIEFLSKRVLERQPDHLSALQALQQLASRYNHWSLRFEMVKILGGVVLNSLTAEEAKQAWFGRKGGLCRPKQIGLAELLEGVCSPFNDWLIRKEVKQAMAVVVGNARLFQVLQEIGIRCSWNTYFGSMPNPSVSSSQKSLLSTRSIGSSSSPSLLASSGDPSSPVRANPLNVKQALPPAPYSQSEWMAESKELPSTPPSQIRRPPSLRTSQRKSPQKSSRNRCACSFLDCLSRLQGSATKETPFQSDRMVGQFKGANPLFVASPKASSSLSSSQLTMYSQTGRPPSRQQRVQSASSRTLFEPESRSERMNEV